MSEAAFCYRAFGLTIASALDIPQLPVVEPPADADIDVRLALGKVEGAPVTAPGLRRGALPSLFRYQAVAGRAVTIEPFAGADPRDMADVIAGHVMAILLYQRGVLPLHASAVIANGALLAFCGVSGCGKSTLAAVLAASGLVVAGDDMLAVQAPAGQPPRAFPGATRLKLSRPAIEHLGQVPDGLPFANTAEEKFLLGRPRADHPAWREGLPLRALVLLGRGAPALRPLRPVEAMAHWRSVVRSTDLFPVAERPQAIWQQWLDVVGAVPAFALDQPGDFGQFSQVTTLVDDLVSRDPKRTSEQTWQPAAKA